MKEKILIGMGGAAVGIGLIAAGLAFNPADCAKGEIALSKKCYTQTEYKAAKQKLLDDYNAKKGYDFSIDNWFLLNDVLAKEAKEKGGLTADIVSDKKKLKQYYINLLKQ